MVLFPGGSGLFNPSDLFSSSTYEVHGEDSSSSKMTSSGPPRAVGPKTLQRSAVYLTEVTGGRLSPSKMIDLECDVIGNQDPLVMTDAQGNSSLESKGTTGSSSWKQNTPNILAVQERDLQGLQSLKRRRLSLNDDAGSIGEVADKIKELVLASQSLPDITKAMKELTIVASRQRVNAAQIQTIKQGFSCVICRKFVNKPIFTQCCRSIIGCKACVELWRKTSAQCAKCRSDTKANTMFEVAGLSDPFSVLRSFVDVMFCVGWPAVFFFLLQLLL
ncbi:uncharacterized protein LOC144033843 [Festucalex cinctus]